MRDECLVPLRDLPRRHPGPPALRAAGHLPQARSWCRQAFSTHNIMLILDGQGQCRQHGRTWLLRAPCLFRQPAGLMGDYGPDTRWEEVFLCYGEAGREALRHRGLWPNQHPVSLLAGDPAWTALARLLASQLRRDRLDADVLDRLAETLLVQAASNTLGAEAGAANPTSPLRDRLLDWERRITTHPANAWDFAAIADDLGVSLQHFRRLWRQRCGHSPDAWLRQRRLQHAQHLLGDPRLSIAAVAQRSGFSDPLYFSRAFKRRHGISPRCARG